ncbi:MFS transporter [Saccharopolyspora indica]|uniref:MFS transporter n=1 Tax=Saccharopolyspora indica TaxID=1229659 RepID=UPI0022EA720E|nr:MFS transporter [Saccharopolyspora indica]MDA3648016.1 MFS transporter [Saccharopolyspora indica]
MPQGCAPPRPTWREWSGLVLVALPLFMMATDVTVLFLAVPSVSADLAPSTTQMLWIIHVGEFAAAGLVITAGRLTDKIGSRRLLLLSMALYGSASALAAFARDPEVLIAGRFLLGAAAGAASPAAFSIMRAVFTDPRYTGTAFAVLIGAFTVGGALGPPMGGLLLEHFGWDSVFLVNVPVAAAVLLGGPLLLPRQRAMSGARIDSLSAGLSTASVISVVFGLQEIAARGPSASHLIVVALGVALGVLFVRRQRRLADPLLDLSLFRIRGLRNSLAVLVLVSSAFVAVDLVLVQYLQIVAQVPAGELGVLLAISGSAAIVGTTLTPVLNRRFRPNQVILAGLSTTLLGAGTIVAAIVAAPELTALFIAGKTLVSLGTAPMMVLGSQLVITAAPQDRAGSAVALQDISAGLGGALGMAFIGSLAMSAFNRALHAGAPHPISAADLDEAGQSPGGAVAVAERIGGTSGQELLQVVRDAWSTGALAACCAALLIGLAAVVLVRRGLRGVHLPTDDAPGDVTARTAS